MAVRAFITGVAGTTLSPPELAFLRRAEPWGVILFARNIENPSQLRCLTGSIRDALARNAPILVDQEGGRVQRLGPPLWPSYPPGATYGRLYEADRAEGVRAAYLGAFLIASDLASVGIDVNCLPIADVPAPGASTVIGDRAYGHTPEKVAAIARSVADGLLDCGVLPVLKHIPGHGRASTDSHHALPVVDIGYSKLESTDFAAFRALADLPLGMTAHVVYSAVDLLAPATTSVTVVHDVIRSWIGFSGLLMTDDISMGALSGSIAERSRAALDAGCDLILHCNGDIQEMEEVASIVPPLAGEAAKRAELALARRFASAVQDVAKLRTEFTALVRPQMQQSGRML
jgi:beta-N-acetylhexosaminidase